MSIYTNILRAVGRELDKAPGRVAHAEPRLRKTPSFVMPQDQLPQLVYAPEPSLAETVVELQFDDGCFISYPVYVGYAVPLDWTAEVLYQRLDLREQVRLALWRDDLLSGLGGEAYAMRCDYDPAPQVPPSAGPNTDESWQKFTFTVSATQKGD